jgi:hypothetical protein
MPGGTGTSPFLPLFHVGAESGDASGSADQHQQLEGWHAGSFYELVEASMSDRLPRIMGDIAPPSSCDVYPSCPCHRRGNKLNRLECTRWELCIARDFPRYNYRPGEVYQYHQHDSDSILRSNNHRGISSSLSLWARVGRKRIVPFGLNGTRKMCENVLWCSVRYMLDEIARVSVAFAEITQGKARASASCTRRGP